MGQCQAHDLRGDAHRHGCNQLPLPPLPFPSACPSLFLCFSRFSSRCLFCICQSKLPWSSSSIPRRKFSFTETSLCVYGDVICLLSSMVCLMVCDCVVVACQKALPWFSTVRKKLEDPSTADWWLRFKDYKGPSSNNSYNVPACTYEKCSPYYHDQDQTPQYVFKYASF